MKTFIPLLAILSLTACATPEVSLENPETNQVQKCGGGSTGAIAGGLIGYEIEKSNDRKCVKFYQSKGFKPIQQPNDASATRQ